MLWLCLWTFAGSGQAKSVSTRINLGETPWKFRVSGFSWLVSFLLSV